MDVPNLRVTRRCLRDDLGLDEELVYHDARDFKDEHRAVTKFVDMRGAAPDLAEPIYGPFPRGLICSLHVGSARAVTTWDEQEAVCWLLAFNDYHRNGEPDDAYEVFLGLYDQGELLPTKKDWSDFFTDDADAFFDRLLATGQQLLERARTHPGREEVMTWRNGRQVMCVDIVVEGDARAEDGWMGLTLPEDEALSDDEVFALAAALIPPDSVPIYSDKFKDRDRRRGEIVYRWEHYEVPQ